MKALFNKPALAAAMLASSAVAAMAAQPTPWQMGFQPAATGIMEEIRWFEQYTLWFIVPITIFVLVLLAIVIFRFSAKANPNPSRTSHNTMIEVVWTVAPVIILLLIAVPSFQLLSKQYTPPSEPTMTIKAIGYQWAWTYEYQADDGSEDISFDAIMLKENERVDAGKTSLEEYPRLLAVDNEVVVPVGETIRLLVTASDVLHSWAMPAFGVKMDAVPGRNNETWFHVDRPGIYYGQCSELCGKDHAFMPIAVRAVERAQYDQWLAAAREDVGAANRSLMASIDASRKLAAANQ